MENPVINWKQIVLCFSLFKKRWAATISPGLPGEATGHAHLELFSIEETPLLIGKSLAKLILLFYCPRQK